MRVLPKRRDMHRRRVATIRCLAMTVVSAAFLVSPLLAGSGARADTGAGLVAAPADPDREGFDLHPANGAARGTWSDGTTMWVADRDADRLYAYSLANGSRQTNKEFDLRPGNDNPEGIWSDGDHFWVVDREDFRAYAYGIDGALAGYANFELATTNLLPRGVWSDGSTMWIVDSYKDSFFIYDRGNGRHISHRTIHLDWANERPYGLWSDGRTIWVVDEDDDYVYAYYLADGSRNPSRDIDLDPENGNAFGIWSDGSTVWVSDDIDARIYTYDLPPPTIVNDPPTFDEGAATTRSMETTDLPGSDVGDPVTATDPDGDTLTYGLAGDDVSLFRIDTHTGQITIGEGLTQAGRDSYSLIVTVQDAYHTSGSADAGLDAVILVTIRTGNTTDTA